MLGQWINKWIKGNKPGQPDFWREYQGHFPGKTDPNIPIGDLSFVVLDTETTGTDPHRASLLSLGAVRIEHLRILVGESLEIDFIPPHRFAPQSIPIHGILPGRKDHQVEVREGLQQGLSFWKASILVGHHIAFDLAVINRYLRRMGAGPLPNEVVDTNTLAVRLLGLPEAGRQAYGLDDLCERFGIRMHDRHTAPGDAFLTTVLFLKLIKALEKRGVQNRSQLLSKGVKRYAY